MLNNLLTTLSFGATIQSNGKTYSVVMRLADRLFVVIDPLTPPQNPQPLLLVTADIQMQQPGADGAGPGQQAPPTPTGSTKDAGNTKEVKPEKDPDKDPDKTVR